MYKVDLNKTGFPYKFIYQSHQTQLVNYWRGQQEYRNYLEDEFFHKQIIFSGKFRILLYLKFKNIVTDTFYTDNNEWFIDKDEKIGILKLAYKTDSDIPAYWKEYGFVMLQDDDGISNLFAGEVNLNSLAELKDFFWSRGIADDRLILLRAKVSKTDIFITDEFEGVFLQEGFFFISQKNMFNYVITFKKDFKNW